MWVWKTVAPPVLLFSLKRLGIYEKGMNKYIGKVAQNVLSTSILCISSNKKSGVFEKKGKPINLPTQVSKA